MTKMINDEFLQIATEQAWKRLSANFGWTESLLEKYSDKVDWTEISGNRNIVWTIPMLQKFSDKIDWKVLSERFGEEWFTKAHLEAFKDKWDWTEISASHLLMHPELIDRFIDYVDWSSLIGERTYIPFSRNEYFDAIGFYEKYKEHIPMSKLQESALWELIVEQTSDQIKTAILS